MRPANYLRLAGMLLQQKRTADAETVVGNLRNRLPKNPDVAGAIAEFYLAARNPDAAIKEYQRGLSIDPKNEKLTIALGEAYLMSGHIEEATKIDEQILKNKPNDVPGRMIKGRLEAIKGDFPAAVTTFRGVVKDAPENPQAHYFLGQALLKTGDLSGAKNEFQEAIKRSPDNPLYLQAQAEAYRDSRDFATAKEFANRLLKLNDKKPAGAFPARHYRLGRERIPGGAGGIVAGRAGGAQRPDCPLEYGIRLRGLKKYPEAEREFQTALKLNPQYDGGRRGVRRHAVRHSTRVPKRCRWPTSTSRPTRIAQPHISSMRSALANSKKLDEAIPEYQKAIQLEPKSLFSYMQLAHVYELQGKNDDGARDLPEGACRSTRFSGYHRRRRQRIFGEERPKVGATVLRKGEYAGPPRCADPEQSRMGVCTAGAKPRRCLVAGDPGQTGGSQRGLDQRHPGLDPVQEGELHGRSRTA